MRNSFKEQRAGLLFLPHYGVGTYQFLNYRGFCLRVAFYLNMALVRCPPNKEISICTIEHFFLVVVYYLLL